MLGYATIGTKDMDRAVAFYDALLAEVGATQLFGMDRIKFYGTGGEGAMLAVCIPYDEKEQSCGNGNMVAIPGGDKAGVDKLYAKALELGGHDDWRLPLTWEGAALAGVLSQTPSEWPYEVATGVYWMQRKWKPMSMLKMCISPGLPWSA